MRAVEWCGKCLFIFLSISIVLLGVGHFELPLPGAQFSAWSVSRTVFFFWLIWKLFVWFRSGQRRSSLATNSVRLPLLIFLAVVTVSLLPTFRNSGDYRYFFFGCMHYLMVLDLFSAGNRTRLLLLLLALAPGFLVVRGILYDSSFLDLSRMIRFGYPLDHPNTAGYLFSMSIPLALGVVASETGRLRNLGVLSLALQGIGLVLTYSRGAWMASAASLLFIGVAAKRYKQVLSLLILAAFVFVLATPLKERFFSLMNPQGDDAINYRIRLMKDSFRLGVDHPVLGIGYGRGRLKESLRETYKGTINETNPIWHAHNVYIELFAETGLLGLGAFLWLLSDSIYRTLQKAFHEQEPAMRIIHCAVLAALVAFMVAGLGDVPFYHHETRIYFFSLLALMHLGSYNRIESARAFDN